MVMPSSGPISIAQAHAEWGLGYNIAAYRGCSPGVPTSGPISLASLYGKKKQNYRFWRIFVESTRSATVSVQIRDLQFRGSIGGPSLTSGGSASTNIGASNYFTGFEPWRAFDGNNSTTWRAGALNANPTNQWVSYDFGGITTIQEIAYTSSTAGGSESLQPVAFRIEASNDGANWVTVNRYTPGIWEGVQTFVV